MGTDINWRLTGGIRLKSARLSRGLTLRDISLITPKFSQSRLSSYENGKRAMNPDVAYELGGIVGASVAHLLCVDMFETRSYQL